MPTRILINGTDITNSGNASSYFWIDNQLDFEANSMPVFIGVEPPQYHTNWYSEYVPLASGIEAGQRLIKEMIPIHCLNDNFEWTKQSGANTRISFEPQYIPSGIAGYPLHDYIFWSGFQDNIRKLGSGLSLDWSFRPWPNMGNKVLWSGFNYSPEKPYNINGYHKHPSGFLYYGRPNKEDFLQYFPKTTYGRHIFPYFGNIIRDQFSYIIESGTTTYGSEEIVSSSIVNDYTAGGSFPSGVTLTYGPFLDKDVGCTSGNFLNAKSYYEYNYKRSLNSNIIISTDKVYKAFTEAYNKNIEPYNEFVSSNYILGSGMVKRYNLNYVASPPIFYSIYDDTLATAIDGIDFSGITYNPSNPVTCSPSQYIRNAIQPEVTNINPGQIFGALFGCTEKVEIFNYPLYRINGGQRYGNKFRTITGIKEGLFNFIHDKYVKLDSSGRFTAFSRIGVPAGFISSNKDDQNIYINTSPIKVGYKLNEGSSGILKNWMDGTINDLCEFSGINSYSVNGFIGGITYNPSGINAMAQDILNCSTDSNNMLTLYFYRPQNFPEIPNNVFGLDKSYEYLIQRKQKRTYTNVFGGTLVLETPWYTQGVGSGAINKIDIPEIIKSDIVFSGSNNYDTKSYMQMIGNSRIEIVGPKLMYSGTNIPNSGGYYYIFDGI